MSMASHTFLSSSSAARPPCIPALEHIQPFDDFTYRFSDESDRGTPRVGIYAQDGLWDDEDGHTSEATTVRPSSTSTFGHPKNQSRKSVTPTTPGPSAASSRGRSNTVHVKEDKGIKMWGWGRKSSVHAHAHVDGGRAEGDESVEVVVTDGHKTLEKKKSKSKLRGKGRRGELSVHVLPDDEYDLPPPVPPTPASFLTNPSPALSSASNFSPASLPSRSQLGPDTSPFTSATGNSEKAKSTWKRGMQKIFKSKSSVALREAFNSVDPNRPAMPERNLDDIKHNLPKPPQRPLGKPFSSSTPPMPTRPALRDTIFSFYGHGSPSSPALPTPTESFHPSLPLDPFASSLDMSSNQLPSSPSSSPLATSKPRLSRNSPSLRDLKNFLAPSKPRMTKAKSMANIRDSDRVPASAPSTKTKFTDVPAGRYPKRVNSVNLLSTKFKETTPEPIEEEASPNNLPRPMLMRMPTESPPLLPPNPPYFPSSLSLPSRSDSSSTGSSLKIDTNLSVSTPPPTSPLPALPSSNSLSPKSSNPMSRSGSGAVLLPRSRSTSMSLKSPPTSSSFFDLYEQLGIWPTPAEKEKEEKESEEKDKENEAPAEVITSTAASLDPSETIAGVVTESPSATFSSGSWEAAISAFPMVEEPASFVDTSLDFGLPYVMDQEIQQIDMVPSPLLDDDEMYEGDRSMISNVAVGGSTCSASTNGHASNRASTSTQRQTTTVNAHASSSRPQGSGSRRLGSSGGAGGSNASSGTGSRDEKRRSERWLDGFDNSSGSSSEEEDDVPLSQLHPQAAAAQTDARKRRAAKKAAKARANGRNPGGSSGWDGEGGIPAESLRQKLEHLALHRTERVFLWQAASASATSTSMRQRTQTEKIHRPHTSGHHSLRPQRSFTDPSRAESLALAPQRSQTVRRSGERHSPLSPITPHATTIPSPTFPQGVTSGMSRTTTTSSKQSAHGTAGPSRATSTSSGHQGPPHTSQMPPVPNVTRSNTAATSRSSRSRSRAISNAAPPTADSSTHLRSITEPLPQRERKSVKLLAHIASADGRRVMVEAFPETTASDVLSVSMSSGELGETSSSGWVVLEVFGELQLERQLREYECLQNVARGWDPLCRTNCFVLRQSNRAPATWARSIPATAPFLGAYVQYESKKGKWSKRFLETRGGQVFLSKNDKNKEEVQINTLFHDIFYTNQRSDGPKSFTFVIKRVEAASTFENPSDYLHRFSLEETTGVKLLAAIYDAKSHAMGQAQPHLLLHAGEHLQRRPTVKKSGEPLVNLEQRQAEKSAFTGKGLLRI